MGGEAELRVACLLIRDFLVALACRGRTGLETKPVIVCGNAGERAEVHACSKVAREAGIHAGMTLRRALATCREAVFFVYEEGEALEESMRIATFLRDLSPAVEVIEPGHVHFDVRGLSALAGMADDVYLADLACTVHKHTGLPVSVGGSSSVFVAHAAASRGAQRQQAVVHQLVRSPRDFLAELPVEVLPVATGVQQRLRLFGLRKLSEVGGMPLAALQAQFGSDGARAWKLVRGEDDRGIMAEADELRAVAETEFSAPTIEIGPIISVTRTILDRAISDANVRGRTARVLEWRLVLENGESVVRRIVFREPTEDVASMMFPLRGRVERLVLSAPAVGLAVTLMGFCSEYAQQARLWVSKSRYQELRNALAELRTRASAHQVYRIVEVQPWSRIPERRLALAPYEP